MLKGPNLNPYDGEKPKQLVLLLHGYGSSGDDLIELGRLWAPLLPHAEFIAFHAPEVCKINSFGYQWFSLAEFTPKEVRDGLDKIGPVLHRDILMLLEKKNLNPENLAIVGFSQGSMLALEMMFLLPNLCCILSYSGAFYPSFNLKKVVSAPHVFLLHGDQDEVVPYTALQETSDQLSSLGVPVRTHTCLGLGHSIDHEGLVLGGRFLQESFS